MANKATKTKSTGRMGSGMWRRPHSIEKAKDIKKSFTRMAAYFLAYKTELIIVFILVVVYTITGLAGPYLLGVAIDDYIETKDLPGLTRIALIMLAAYLLSFGLRVISNWIMASASQRALKKMRSDLFNQLQILSLRFFDRNPAGDLMSRLTNDINEINRAVAHNVTSFVANILTLVGILVAMFSLSGWLALASVLIVPLMVWFTMFVAKYTRKGFRKLQKQIGQLNGTIEETISGQRVVKAFRRSESAIGAFKKRNQAVYESGVTANTYAFLLMPLTGQLGNLFIIILAGLGGWLALQGIVTVGLIATFISYSRQFLQPVRQLANMYNSIQAALAGAERVFHIIDTEPELKDAQDAESLKEIQGHIEFDHVHFAYNKDVPVIKNMTFEAREGHTVALVGPTGAGKTTIINLLARFYDVDSGSIRIDGKDIRNVKKDDLRRNLGIVLQDTFLFSDSVLENIRYGRLDATDEECIEAAKMADADYFIRQLHEGYNTQLSERANNLSQGQRQMLAISRAILANPSILILDEATSSVDTRTEAHIQTALLKLMKGRTSFVIAHRLSTIRDADYVLVINEGEIVEQGNHDELIKMRGFYYNLYLSQFKGQKI
ncbi:MAG: ABC transporter ATP-binding protein [Anaerolineaceae bacterium]|nr:ABC transporter ATP-binding protein [Anaerolineaceae bacterium]